MAYQAYLPQNVQKRWEYWHLPYPLGMSNVQRSQIIDLDEASMYLDAANRPGGKAFSGFRVREPGPHTRGSEKFTLLMAISGRTGQQGDPSPRWTSIWQEGGTTIARMLDFVQLILNDIGPATPESWYCFTMDNLNSHKNPMVVNLIYAFGHGVCFRAPYYAVDGAIEYVFNNIQTLVRSRLYEVQDGADLLQVITQSIQGIDDFSGFFRNVGFVID